NFELVKKRFPKLKIVSRGTEIKVFGEPQELTRFQDFFSKLLEHIERYERLTPEDISHLLNVEAPASGPLISGALTLSAPEADEAPTSNKASGSGTGEPIVFGPKGLVVKARTPNQRRLVDSVLRNDIVFA